MVLFSVWLMFVKKGWVFIMIESVFLLCLWFLFLRDKDNKEYVLECFGWNLDVIFEGSINEDDLFIVIWVECCNLRWRIDFLSGVILVVSDSTEVEFFFVVSLNNKFKGRLFWIEIWFVCDCIFICSVFVIYVVVSGVLR